MSIPMKNQKISSLLMRKEVPSMATTRIMPLHIGKGRTESQAISDIIDYVANPQKTDNGKLITGYGCDSRTADAEFLLAKRHDSCNYHNRRTSSHKYFCFR